MDPPAPSRLILKLELDRNADSFSGTANAGDGQAEAFRGWIGLAAAVEAWRSAGAPGDGARRAPACEPESPQGRWPGR